MRQAKGFVAGLGIMAVVFIMASFTTVINFVTDYQWFKELGYEQVFLTKLMNQLKIGIPAFIIFTVLIYLYLISIKKDYCRKVQSIYISLNEKQTNYIAMGGAAFVGFLASTTLAGNLWFELLGFLNATKFKMLDPIFNKDIAFYMFQLPLITQIYYLSIGFILLLAVVTFVFYLVMISIRRPTLSGPSSPDWQTTINRGLNGENGKRLLNIALRQMLILGIVFFIILGLGYLLKSYDLLYSTRGVAYGASFTDINVTLWIYRVMMVLSLVSAVLLVIGARTKKLRLAVTGPVIMMVATIVGNVGAVAVQNYIVAPNEISKERKYLEYNIDYTKMAYGLDKIEEKSFEADYTLTKEDIDNNKETISNIRVNDYRPTKQFYNQRQGIRLYYQFNDVDVDRYNVDGQYTQVLLSAREIDYAKINEAWINQHLKYTHGYGVALSPVNAITVEGQPELLISNIPPESKIKNLDINRPEIYFGELTNNYILTNTKDKEFDYPSGEDNAETFYGGTAGIKLGGLNKLLFSIKEGSLKMLVAGNVTADSKILLYRNINERVRKIAPFMEYDNDPYLIIDEGKLYWMIDGYTVSTNYPYAEPYVKDRGNYIRNSVKVVIDAYNGDTTYYVSDEDDPVIQTYRKIFPQLFTSMDKMPDGIKSHIRYPQTLFDIQANVYKTYHMNNTDVFYQQEDLWDIANEIYEREQEVMESNYSIMKLPGEAKEEFLLSIPYTPKNKPNMTALLMARNDGDSYGKLLIYKLPKQKNIYGPMQIESKIDQDTNISKEFSLWGQQGSNYMRGNLLTIPINDSFLYVESIYLKSDNENSLPEVKRVVVAYGDRMAYEETLDKALESLFGKTVEKPTDTQGELPPLEVGDQSTQEIIIRANQVFNQAQQAQRDGNWAEYGKYIDELKIILGKLTEVSGS